MKSIEKTEILFSKEDIAKRIHELGKVITDDFKDKKLMIVVLLKGGFQFAADLSKKLDMNVHIEFMRTSSYSSETTSSHNVKIINDIEKSIEDFHILIVDDIIDTGFTLKKVKEHIESKNPLSLKSVCFLDKPSRRIVDIEADYIGYTVDDMFVVGYGLDYQDKYRNLPYIFVFKD